MTRFTTAIVAICVCGISTCAAWAQKDDVKKAAAIDRKKLEEEFAEKLAGVALTGQFSITTSKDPVPSKPDSYKIDKVTKLKGDYWMFHYRKSPQLVIPIALKVVWAGDTPMISMTDVTIPTMGTFSARIMFHGNLYAGTWQHGKVGGHMWGKIEKLKQKPKQDSKSKK